MTLSGHTFQPACRYFEVHCDFAWLEAGLIADRHYARGDMPRFSDWVRVANRLDELLPWPEKVD